MPVIWQTNCLYVEECASDLAEELHDVPVIWQNFLYVEERASDLSELPAVPVILQNCLSVYVEERASNLAKFPVVEVHASDDLAEFRIVSEQCSSNFAELLVCGGWRGMPVIWQNCRCQ